MLGTQAVASAAKTSSQPTTASKPAERWRIGCSTRPWDQYDYPVAFEAIAEAGYRYVGPMTAKTPSGRVIHPESTSAEIARVREELESS